MNEPTSALSSNTGDHGQHSPLPPASAVPPASAASVPTSARVRCGAVESLIHKALKEIEHARPMPLSSSVIINRDELLTILTEALELLPEELQAARWLLKERDDMRERMKREGDDIIAAARSRAEQMVQRSEVKKEADRQARNVIQAAEGESVRMKLETEDWCDQRLAGIESLLQKSLNAILTGRQRLQDTRLPKPEADKPSSPPTSGVYDYDTG